MRLGHSVNLSPNCSGTENYLNPFTVMMSFETTIRSAKFETIFYPLFPFSHWYVEGFSSKRIALKVDVI